MFFFIYDYIDYIYNLQSERVREYERELESERMNGEGEREREYWNIIKLIIERIQDLQQFQKNFINQIMKQI